jgi:hypothetical protein
LAVIRNTWLSLQLFKLGNDEELKRGKVEIDRQKNKKPHQAAFISVPRIGLEPIRPLLATGF